MTIQAQLADGRILEFPDGTDPAVIQATVKRMIAAANPPKEGILAALIGGTKRFGSTLETGLESLINPELAAKRGAARQEEIGQQYAPGASLEKVKQAYEQKGLFPAAYEAVSQIPAALAEQAPQIASSFGGARAGAAVGSMFGPAGSLVGGIGGAFAAPLLQLYGANLERQSQEKAPEISRAKALGAAVPGAGLEVASTFIPLGRNLIGKLLGPEAEKALARGASEGVEAAAKESLKKSLAKGAGVGALAEVPTEVTQQMLERLQAGLPVTTPDALAEYGEAAYGAAMVGAPFGAAARGFGRPAAREQYEKQLQGEQLKAQQEKDKQAADALKQQEQQLQTTQSNLGVPVTGENVSNVLLLPAPAKEVEVEKDPLLNPVGRITEDELGKAIGNNTVVNYLNKYRKENNLPKLKSYSIEDIKDAMTAQNPEGEEGALNSILAYKTNYQNETYTPEDIQNRAVAKNVATETKGWNDFLTRTTGKSDVNTMTQPELHSVATALDALKRTGKEEQLVLPEGSNATRFTQDQYNQGITTALMGVKEGKPVSLEQAREAIKAQTDLKTDRDADHLLKTAASNEDLIVEKGTGFQAVSPGGVTLGTYGTESEARRNHRRADILPVETELVRAPEEVNQEKVVQLPEGFEINKKTVAGEAGPAAYVIREADSQKNASQTFAEESDAKERLNILARKREANALAEEAAADRIRQDLEKKQAKIAQMEADGQADTAEHKNAVNAFQAANVTGSAKITEHLDKAEAFRKPLKIVPLGKKTAKVEKHVVTKGGKPVASFDTNDKAQSHVLSLLDNNTLESIAERGGVVGERAKLELDMRERPGVRGGTTEGLEKAGVRTPEVEAKLRELEAKLIPMLKKFGLEDVGLKVVRAIENDAEGAWGGLNNLIRIAFNATNPIRTMRHEALHALKELGFFTPQQWEALKRQAEKTWVNKYLKNVAFNETMSRYDAYANGIKDENGKVLMPPLSYEGILEEAIADAFGDFEAAGKAPAGMLDALFKRLKQFFAALRQGLTGAGFESADEIFGKIERGELKAGKREETEGEEKFALKTVQDVIDDGIRRLVESARKHNVRNLQERMGVGLARADTSFTKIEDGIEKRLAALGVSTNPQDDNNAFGVVFNKVHPAVNEQLRKDAEERNKQSLNRPSQDNAWEADEQTIKAADKYEEENGIKPYVSEGFLDLPTDGTKYSLQKYNPEKHLSFDAALGVPINKDGLITLYYHTTKEKAVQIGNKKIIPSEGRNRVYLTNESNGADVLNNRGNFDQELDGSTVLVYVHPDILQVDDVQENGRRDFFIPLAQGDFFNKKMKLQSIQKSRTSPITEIFSYTEHEQKIADAVNAYKNATPAERRKLVSSARKLLKQEHNVGSLLSENGKLEKTRVGEYDLDWEGNSVASMGLGLASAQQISEKVSTCPRSAICEGLCLGETSGGNFMFGGAASEDVGEIKKSSFRAAARMMQYLKTEALIVHPEEFAMVLQAEIDSLAKWCASETQTKRNPETKKNEKIEKEIYQPAVRLNVTSDFKPSMFRAIIEANPDTMFYDYTKLGSESIAPNHHLTYSSTGFGQIVNGEKVFFKDKSGKYDHNWATMRSRLNKGQNVAMAFSSKSGIPSFLADEETGVQYRVWNGDDYDARFLDPKQPDGKGMIIGLKNKAGNLKESTATKQTGGFFVQYDPKTDGDTVVVPNQNQFKGLKDVTVTTVKPGEKYSLRAPDTKEFKQWFGDSKVVDENGKPLVIYRGVVGSEKNGIAEGALNAEAREGYAAFGSSSPYVASSYANPEAVYEETGAVTPLYIKADKLIEFPVTVDKYGSRRFDYFEMDRRAQALPAGTVLVARQVVDIGPRAKSSVDPEKLYSYGSDVYAWNRGTSVKSAIGNKGTYDVANPDTRYSLPTYFPTAEEAENAAYQKAPPSTPEFKRFFGASKVKEEGRPQVMYHASTNVFDEFRENKPIFISPDPKWAEQFGKSRAEAEQKNDVMIYPLWVRAETPFDFENKVHTQKLLDRLMADSTTKDGMIELKHSELMGTKRVTPDDYMKKLKEGDWTYIENDSAQAALKTLGFDSFYVKESGAKNLAVLKANQVKSVTGNIGDFSENKSIKYSLPTVSAAAQARRDETTQQREHKGFVERILDVFKPESMADLRASFIHRYNQLGVYDKMLAEKMGDRVLMADMSAEAAANMSDLSASVTYAAFGIGNRQGGIPVYKNGTTTIDTSVKGPLQILSPLAQFNDPTAYQDYQFWAGVKRGSRFMAEKNAAGVVSFREKNFEPDDIAKAEEFRKAYMAKGVDFTVIQKEMNTFNDGLVDYMKATGVLAPERAAEFKKHMDYIPFYRQLDGQDTVGPKIFNSISGVKPPKKLKGSEAPLTDYLESIVQNTQAAINAGMKNMAAQRAISVAMQLGPRAGAERLNAVSSAPDTVQVLENGKQVSYRVADQLFINAVKNLNMAEIPFMGIFSAPSNMLRNLVTKDPGFMLANLARDSLSAWVTSGSNMTPIAGTVSNFVKALSGKDKSLHALYNAGILGGYEFSSGVIKSGEVLEKDLSKRYGSKGVGSPLKVFSGVWDALEKGTEASDAATRMAVYERVLAETGNETEALYRALEVMNFNRKGSSPVVRILTAAIPFLNARIQGLDVFYRTAMGKNVLANSEAMQKAFFVRGATLMALSAAYFLAVSDDDEWKKQEQETKDNYWIAPGIGKFPTPFEVGFLFKTVPERIMAYMLKDDTGQDLMDSMRRGLLNTFAFNPIPQIAKPLVEYSANYNFFTGRPIVGQGMEGLEPQYQVGPNTTQSMEWLGKQLGMSPIKLEQVYGGYTGTMGMYALSLFDSVLQTQSDSPHASKRFEQLPVIKRFAADPEARGNITQYYELKKAVDAAVQTQNLLLKSGKPEEFAEFMEKNKGLLAIRPYVTSVESTMKQMREARKMIQGADMTGDEKRDALIVIGQAENNLNANIQTIKKMISEVQ